MGQIAMTLVDFDGDTKQTSFESRATNNDGSTYAGDLTDAIALWDAILAIVLGNSTRRTFSGYDLDNNPANPSDEFAQVNIQWVFEWTDNVTGQVRHRTLGTADLAQATILYNGAPAVDLSTGVGATLKTAFEDIVRNDGNAVTLNAVYYKE